jgi:hypothetical protein
MRRYRRNVTDWFLPVRGLMLRRDFLHARDFGPGGDTAWVWALAALVLWQLWKLF